MARRGEDHRTGGARRPGHHRLDASGLLTQFRHDGTGFSPRTSPVAVDERPPLVTVPEYRARWAEDVG